MSNLKLSDQLKKRSKNNFLVVNEVLIDEVEALEKQIEVMKCCDNCQWKSHYTSDESIGCESFEYDGICGWKLKEAE